MFPTSDEVRKWTTMFDQSTFYLPPEKVPLTEKKVPDTQAVRSETTIMSHFSACFVCCWHAVYFL